MTDTVHEPSPQLLTLGEISERLGVSTHRLKYAIEQYKIPPTRRVGIIRVWSDDKIPLIQKALAQIAENRGGARR
jgi:DNA-binding transcriptional MerR regulator